MPLFKTRISSIIHGPFKWGWLPNMLLFIFFVLALSACIKERNAYRLNDQVDISFKNRASIILPDTTFVIRFIDFVEESRCQPFTNCISEGEAIVNLELNFSESVNVGVGNKSTLEPKNIYDTVGIGNYNVRLLGVHYAADAYFGIVEKSFISLRIEEK